MYELWLNKTYQIYSVLVSRGRQNHPRHCGEKMGPGEVKTLLWDHSQVDSALAIERGLREGIRGRCTSL